MVIIAHFSPVKIGSSLNDFYSFYELVHEEFNKDKELVECIAKYRMIVKKANFLIEEIKKLLERNDHGLKFSTSSQSSSQILESEM